MKSSEAVPRRGGIMRGAMYLGIGQVVTTVLTIMLSATLARH